MYGSLFPPWNKKAKSLWLRRIERYKLIIVRYTLAIMKRNVSEEKFDKLSQLHKI